MVLSRAPATIGEACTSRACSGSITPVPRANWFIGTDVGFHAARNCCRADQQVHRQVSLAGKAQPALAYTPPLGADLPRIARIHWFGYGHGPLLGAGEAALPQVHRRSSSSRPRLGSFLASASRYISGTTSRDHESCPASWPTPGAIAAHFRLSGLDLYGLMLAPCLLGCAGTGW